MHGELIERLRYRMNRHDDGCSEHGRLRNPDGPEAADALEALTARIAQLEAERDGMREALRVANEPHWFYYGNDCSSDRCRDSIYECIDEDFEWDNRPEGDHVLLISGARPVPDIWVALHYYTEDEKDARDSDDQYTFTEHETKEEAESAIRALKEQPHD